jgi:hypothetical protein
VSSTNHASAIRCSDSIKRHAAATVRFPVAMTPMKSAECAVQSVTNCNHISISEHVVQCDARLGTTEVRIYRFLESR